MLLSAIGLIVTGALTLGLARVPQVVEWQVNRFVRIMDLPEQSDHTTLTTRMRHRIIGAGVGLIVGGAGLATSLPFVSNTLDVIVVWVVTFTALAAGVAAAEIWRSSPLPPGTPRTARITVPRQIDYLPLQILLGTWIPAAVAFSVAVLALLLARSPSFNSASLTSGAVPVIAGALALLGILTAWGTHRILATPEPASDEADPFTQDAVRAATLVTLHTPLLLLALLSTPLVARLIDDAASMAAVTQGAPGPECVTWLIMGTYSLGLVIFLGVIVLALPLWRDTAQSRFRNRLWSGQIPKPSTT